ncbi:BTAD domain-containing putative transcriptional regulator [Streptomyces sp. SCSIO 30461]|uniref:BTAD domain-containing putative transcriptional regulator n=1 Tax=Streptomyces sp. SCSIO 30461 TaxID=3118085 RepID=UPI0030CEC666
MITHSPWRQRLNAAVTAVGTLALALTLLAGMPYVLWRAAGIPWPEHVSSLAEFGQRLLQPVSDPLMIDLLAVTGWLCWAAFAFSVIRETIWYTTHLPQLLRSRHAHHEHLATLSLRGSMAALCVGTLVVAVLTLCRPHPAGAQQPTSSGELRAHIAATAPIAPVPVAFAFRTAKNAADSTEAMPPGSSSSPAVPHGQAQDLRHIEYTVIEGDSLWDIAHTHLGDGINWPRIYALNKDRTQCDGARLTDPDLLRPGWQLTIPATSAIARPSTPPPADPPPVTPPTSPAENSPAQAPSHQHADTGRSQPGAPTPAKIDRSSGASTTRADATQGPAAISLGSASLIGITTAAGLLAARRYWFWHQRRLREPDKETEVPALSPLVDKAARAAHAATQPRLPQDPDALITRRTPPQQPQPSSTVTIGVRDDTEVPLDALATPGGCAWVGPGAEGAARALLVGILTAAERQRPKPPHVQAIVPKDVADRLLPGLPAQFTALTQSSDLTQAIRAAEQRLIAYARTQAELEAGPVATEAEHAHAAERSSPGTLLLLAVPDAATTGQMQALAARSRPGGLIVLTLGTALHGAARWQVSADGTTIPQSYTDRPSPLRLFHLSPEAGQDMTDVLLTAHGQRPRLRILPIPHQPAHDKHPEPPTESESESDDRPCSPYSVDTASRPTQTKPVRLHVLGPITLYARGNPDPIGTNLRSEVHEFLALLAAHPTGLLASDIADKLHLAPGSDQNALKNLRRAVRRALRAATGITAQEFVLLQGEFHKLHPDLVEIDLADFTRCLKGAFSAPSTSGDGDENTALAVVCDALTHYRGPFAQGSDYLWADAIREHLATQASDAALRLARQAERADAAPQERTEALALLEHLGTLHPDHERLAQHTIRLYQTAGRHDAARHTYTRLERHLADLGLAPEPVTKALVTPRSPAGVTR